MSLPLTRKIEPPRIAARFRYGRRRLRRISKTATLGGIFLSFLKIGLTGFGGGLAVISQIRTLAVRERRWFTEREFAEAFALAQSLPGTNAGNAAAYIGLRLRGWRGACVALVGFILPSMLMMIGLAILYRHLRSIPDTDRLFHGLNAAVVAFIITTAWRIGRGVIVKRWQWCMAIVACAAVAAFRATTIEVILLSGLVGVYVDSFAEKRWHNWQRIRRLAARRRERLNEINRRAFVGGHLTRALAEQRVHEQQQEKKSFSNINANDALPAHNEIRQAENSENASGSKTGKAIAKGVDETRKPSHRPAVIFFAAGMPVLVKLSLLVALSTVFLRVGAVTFGGGFVMLPLIEAEVVTANHWLTHQEFADAAALGQLTPGPVLITATFIGYRVAGTLGAIFATIAVFLPAFVMTVVAGSSLRRFQSNRQVQAFLRGVTPAVVGLLVAAAWSVGRAGIHTWIGLTIMLLCVGVLVRFRPNPFWVILGAGLARFAFGLWLG